MQVVPILVVHAQEATLMSPSLDRLKQSLNEALSRVQTLECGGDLEGWSQLAWGWEVNFAGVYSGNWKVGGLLPGGD
jgi:hypothetical protein